MLFNFDIVTIIVFRIQCSLHKNSCNSCNFLKILADSTTILFFISEKQLKATTHKDQIYLAILRKFLGSGVFQWGSYEGKFK